MFRVGDKVKVINNGQTHNKYQKFATTHGLECFKSGKIPVHNSTGVIVVAGNCDDKDIFGVLIDSTHYIISSRGLELVCPCNKTPHVHAELIKAWADGAKIEYKTSYQDGWFDAPNPGWVTSFYYRIKVEPKVEVKYIKVSLDEQGKVKVNTFNTEQFDTPLELTFTNGKLVSARLL